MTAQALPQMKESGSDDVGASLRLPMIQSELIDNANSAFRAYIIRTETKQARSVRDNGA